MDVITAITSVFKAMGDWFVEFIPTLISLFYNSPSGSGADATPGGLTFLGVLAVCGLAISVFFLIMGLIQNFLHFRG